MELLPDEIKGEHTFSTFNGYIFEVERHFDQNFS